jgi:hypothetical protein
MVKPVKPVNDAPAAVQTLRRRCASLSSKAR